MLIHGITFIVACLYMYTANQHSRRVTGKHSQQSEQPQKPRMFYPQKFCFIWYMCFYSAVECILVINKLYALAIITQNVYLYDYIASQLPMPLYSSQLAIKSRQQHEHIHTEYLTNLILLCPTTACLIELGIAHHFSLLNMQFVLCFNRFSYQSYRSRYRYSLPP